MSKIVVVSLCFSCFSQHKYFGSFCRRVGICSPQCKDSETYQQGHYHHPDCTDQKSLCYCGKCDSQYRICPNCRENNPRRTKELWDLLEIKIHYDKLKKTREIERLERLEKNQVLVDQYSFFASKFKSESDGRMPILKLVNEHKQIEEMQRIKEMQKQKRKYDVDSNLSQFPVFMKPGLIKLLKEFVDKGWNCCRVAPIKEEEEDQDNETTEDNDFTAEAEVEQQFRQQQREQQSSSSSSSSFYSCLFIELQTNNISDDPCFLVESYCQKCYKHCTLSAALFSKREIKAMLNQLRNDGDILTMDNKQYQNLMIKLINIQLGVEKKDTVSSLLHKQVEEFTGISPNQLSVFIQILRTKLAYDIAKKRINEFKKEEKRRIKKICDQSMQMLNEDLEMIKSMLCYFWGDSEDESFSRVKAEMKEKGYEVDSDDEVDSDGDVIDFNPEFDKLNISMMNIDNTDVIRQIFQSDRFQKLMKGQFVYLDYVEANNRFLTLEFKEQVRHCQNQC